MRILVVFANPNAKSFGAALHSKVVKTLRSNKHEVDDCDLYAEGFDPVMSPRERENYHNPAENLANVRPFATRLQEAQGLVLIYPVWNEGFPAIMKGFFDRVFIPGVSFALNPDGSVMPKLEKMTKLAAVCTYGASRLQTILLGDPPRRVVKRLVRAMPGHQITCEYLGHYGMNHTTDQRRSEFLRKVGQAFQSW